MFVNDLQGVFLFGRVQGRAFLIYVSKLERLKIFLVCCLWLLSSCKKDEAVVPDYLNPYRFPFEVQEEIKTFLDEGNKRGVYCDINNIKKIILTGELIASDGNKADAFYRHSSNTIYIDTTSIQYKIKKEALIFHELGHGLLKREHKNGGWFNGKYPFSIMNATDSILPDYNGPREYQRPYYIDELFNPFTPEPYWVK